MDSMEKYIFHLISGKHNDNETINERINIILAYCKKLGVDIAQKHIVVAPEYFLSTKSQDPVTFMSVDNYRAIKKRFIQAGLSDNVILIPGTCTRLKSLQSEYDQIHTKFEQAPSHEKKLHEEALNAERNRLIQKGKYGPTLINVGYKHNAFKAAYSKLAGDTGTYHSCTSNLKKINSSHDYCTKSRHELENSNSQLTLNSLLIIKGAKKLGTYNKMTNFNEHEFESGFCFFPGGSNPSDPFQARDYELDGLNCSFEICYDHNQKIRKTIIDDIRFRTKPSQVHFILSDSVTTDR